MRKLSAFIAVVSLLLALVSIATLIGAVCPCTVRVLPVVPARARRRARRALGPYGAPATHR